LNDYVILYDAKKDSRAVFTFAYVTITKALAEALPLTSFNSPAWVVLLAEHFATLYMHALQTSETSPDNLPLAWKEVFQAIGLKRTSVLEDLIFSMTAHIVHDLPLALVEVGFSNPDGTSCIGDFHRMNDVLATNVQKIADAVSNRYEPVFRWLDQFEKRHTEILTNYGFRVSRGMAWYNANRLLDPKSAEDANGSINRTVVILVEDVRDPPVWSVRIILRGMRFLAGLLRRWPKARPAQTISKIS
jgi:hypothetical protein